MYLIITNIGGYQAVVNLDNFDTLEIYESSDNDYSIYARRFYMEINIETGDTMVKDMTLTLARYRTVSEAEEVMFQIVNCLDAGIKNIFRIPKDTIEDDAKNEEKDLDVENILSNMEDDDKNKV